MAPGPSQDTPVGMMPGAPPMGLQKPATLPIRQPVGQQNLPIGFGISKETPKGEIQIYLLMVIDTYKLIATLCLVRLTN